MREVSPKAVGLDQVRGGFSLGFLGGRGGEDGSGMKRGFEGAQGKSGVPVESSQV